MLYISNFLIKIYVCCCIIIRWSEPLLQHPIKKKKEVPHSPMKKSWRRNCGAQSLRWPLISKVANARKRAWCWVILEGKRRERCSSLTKSIWTKGTKKQSFSSNFSFIAILKMSVLPCWLLQSSRAWALEASLLMKWLDPLKLFFGFLVVMLYVMVVIQRTTTSTYYHVNNSNSWREICAVKRCSRGWVSQNSYIKASPSTLYGTVRQKLILKCCFCAQKLFL